MNAREGLATLLQRAPDKTVAFFRRPLVAAFLSDKVTLVSALVVVVVVICAAFAPLVSPHDPYEQQLRLRHLPPGSTDAVLGDNARGRFFLLGTDELGRDLLSRLIYGARVSLTVGASGVGLASIIGLVLGLVSGYYRGIVDDVVMRTVDVFMTVPLLMFALLVLFILGPSFINIILVFDLAGWTLYARTTRGLVMSLREQPFIDAARTIGCTDRRILFRHITPNVMTPLLTLAALAVPAVILGEATLSFLGFGIQPPESSWGLILAKGRDYITSAWWVVAFPGLAIFITTLSINLFGVWIRAVNDPVQRWRWLNIPKEFRSAR